MSVRDNGEITAPMKAPGPKTKLNIVLGAQWGDEGKGKLVDILATNADLVCRCQVRTRVPYERDFNCVCCTPKSIILHANIRLDVEQIYKELPNRHQRIHKSVSRLYVLLSLSIHFLVFLVV